MPLMSLPLLLPLVKIPADAAAPASRELAIESSVIAAHSTVAS